MEKVPTIAHAVDEIAIIARQAGVLVEISIMRDDWYDVGKYLGVEPRPHRNPTRPPYFIWKGARVELTMGAAEWGYRE